LAVPMSSATIMFESATVFLSLFTHQTLVNVEQYASFYCIFDQTFTLPRLVKHA